MRDLNVLLKYATQNLSITPRDIELMKKNALWGQVAAMGKRLLPMASRVLKPTSKIGKMAATHVKSTAGMSAIMAAGADEKHPERGFLSRFGHNMTNWKYHAAAGAYGVVHKPMMNMVGKGGLKMMTAKGTGKLAKTVRGVGGYVASTSGEAANAIKQSRNVMGLGSSTGSSILGIGNKAAGTSQREIGKMATELLKGSKGSTKVLTAVKKKGFDTATKSGKEFQVKAMEAMKKGDLTSAREFRALREQATSTAKGWEKKSLKEIGKTGEYADEFFKGKGYTKIDGGVYKDKTALFDFAKKNGVSTTGLTDDVIKGGHKTINKHFKSKGVNLYSNNHKMMGFNTSNDLGAGSMLAETIAPVGSMSLVAPVLASGVAMVPGVGGYAAKPLNVANTMWQPEEFGDNLQNLVKTNPTGGGVATREGNFRWKNSGGKARRGAARPTRYFGR